jgi:hypothetical protein
MQAIFVARAALRCQPQETSPMLVRNLVTVAALCLFGASANALTMEECKANYKAAIAKKTFPRSWVDYQERYCGINDKAAAPKPAPAAPVKQ